MKKLVLIAALMVTASAAQAEDIAPMECQLLPVHVAKDDVAYKPGVDVKGKKVVPADLDAPTMDLPKTILIPLSVDMSDKLQNNGVDGAMMEAPLGMLEIHPNGRVVYNGKDLTPQVYALCGRETVPELTPSQAATDPVSAPAPATKAAPDGQAGTDTIKSDAVEVAPAKAVPPEGMMIEGGESRQEGLSAP